MDELLKEKITTGDQELITRAWELIHDQFFDHAKNLATQEGPGISIFRFLRDSKEDGSNCEYYYASQNGKGWELSLEQSPDKEMLEKLYDPSRHLMFCVHVPYGEQGDHSIGSIKLFDIETKELFPIQDSV